LVLPLDSVSKGAHPLIMGTGGKYQDANMWGDKGSFQNENYEGYV
jgi:hypothetical protein